MPMAHPAESRRKPRRDWNVSRSICFVSSLYFFVQNSDFRRHRSAVLSGTTMVNFPHDDGKLFRGSSHTFFRFFQTIRFRKVYTASATRNTFPALHYETHTVPSILSPLRRPAAETELPVSDPDPGFHILRSDLPSKNHLFYPVCLLVLHYALYYTFLIRKKQAIAAAKSSL